MATATPTSTGAEEIHWDLTHLYPGDARNAIEADLSQADELAQGFDRDYRRAVAGLDADGMVEALNRLEEIQELLGKIASYAFLDFSTDVADAARGALLQKVQESMTQTGTRLLFFNLQWLAGPHPHTQAPGVSPQMVNSP